MIIEHKGSYYEATVPMKQQLRLIHVWNGVDTLMERVAQVRKPYEKWFEEKGYKFKTVWIAARNEPFSWTAEFDTYEEALEFALAWS